MSAITSDLGRMVLDQSIHLVEISASRRITQNGETPLGDGQVEVLHGGVGQGLPHRFCLRSERKLLEQVDGFCELLAFEAGVEGNEPFIELVLHHINSLVHNNARASARAFDVLDVSLDLVQGHAIWGVDRVPDAKVPSVLRHHDVAVWHPLHIVAVVEQGHAHLLVNIIEVQLTPLVAEEQLVCAIGIQLQPIDARIVLDGSESLIGDQIADSHRRQIQ
mmetsp:Transcript_90215/g.197610  ORF Transcript_90215/g.197610 Transcript_90215/m.197610 type:complete len:220 (-) Transcript_90215:635-1294(-)